MNRFQLLRFLATFLILFAYSFWSFSSSKRRFFWVRQGVIVAFVWIILWQFGYGFFPSVLQFHNFGKWARIGSILMGFFALSALLTLPVDLFYASWMGLCFLKSRFFPDLPYYSERRTFLSQGLLRGSLWGSAGLLTYLGWREVKHGPWVQRVPIHCDLPEGLNHLKIVQISDLHVGSTVRRTDVENVVQKTNALCPDLIFVTGDLADAEPAWIESDIAPLSQLKATRGIYYVTGNHEYYWGVAQWIQRVRQFGWIPLINENCVLNIQGAKLLIAGVTDPLGGQFSSEHSSDVARAVKSAEEVDFRILLAHRPEAYLEATKVGVHLQFSGHTHGGQFFPVNFLVPWVHRYYRGLNRHHHMWVYVNSGTGYWGPSNRLGVPSEITYVQLVRSVAA